MTEYTDKYDNIIKDGDIIDIHQTVNGEKRFVVLTLDPLDIRYGCDIDRKYEYSKEELLDIRLYGETETEIVGNIYNYING